MKTNPKIGNQSKAMEINPKFWKPLQSHENQSKTMKTNPKL